MTSPVHKPCADCGHSIDDHKEAMPGMAECACGCLGWVSPALKDLFAKPSVLETCMCDGGGSIAHTPKMSCTVFHPHIHCNVCPQPFGKHTPDCPNA